MAYRITHDKTGEVHVGTPKEISEITGVLPSSLSAYATYGKKVAKVWKIEALPDNTPKVAGTVPTEMWKEWEEVTAPFKKAIARYQRKKVC